MQGGIRLAIGPLVAWIGLIGAAPQDRPQAEDEVVIEGQRDQKRLQGGIWDIELSRAYAFGRRIEDQNEARPMGRDRSWRFCLADADVEPLMRILVGEGRTESSGNTDCAPLVVTIGEGKLRATQSCTGGTIRETDPLTQRAQPVAARNKLTVTGRYTPTALTIDFDDRRSAFDRDPAYVNPPYGRRWSIKGRRAGAC